MPEKPTLREVDPNTIIVPEVRITADWDPELYDMFRASVKEMGIQEPILCSEDQGKLVLVDGLHRLQEAKLAGMRKVRAVVIPGSLKDAMLKNLILNRLRGKTKTSELTRVVMELLEKFGVSYEELCKTGLNRDYIDKVLFIRDHAIPAVKQALDQERISVSHAALIAKVPNEDSQKRLLSLCERYNLKVDDLRDVVEETIRILQEREKRGAQAPAPVPPPPTEDTVKCHLCERERPISKIRGFNICIYCWGIAEQAVRKALAEEEEREARKKAIAQQVTQTETPPPS
jgi:ParB family chromosome partitioning protein